MKLILLLILTLTSTVNSIYAQSRKPLFTFFQQSVQTGGGDTIAGGDHQIVRVTSTFVDTFIRYLQQNYSFWEKKEFNGVDGVNSLFDQLKSIHLIPDSLLENPKNISINSESFIEMNLEYMGKDFIENFSKKILSMLLNPKSPYYDILFKQYSIEINFQEISLDPYVAYYQENAPYFQIEPENFATLSKFIADTIDHCNIKSKKTIRDLNDISAFIKKPTSSSFNGKGILQVNPYDELYRKFSRLKDLPCRSWKRRRVTEFNLEKLYPYLKTDEV